MGNINDLRLNQALRMQQSSGAAAAVKNVARPSDSGASFETLLQEQLNKNSKSCELQFSKHAQQRVDQRGIQMTDTLMQELNNAVDKAQAKGAKDVVIFDAKQAFIVNVPNRTVITAISGSEMKDNVFTNIDSAVMI